MGKETARSAPSTGSRAPRPLPDRLPTLETIYAPIDGYTIARDARRKLREQGDYAKSEGLQYGEIDLPAFARFLQELLVDPELALPTDKPLTFADVGSGTGKPVLLAALFPQIGRSLGIEIVPALHEQAAAALEQLASDWPDVRPRVDLQCASCFTSPKAWLAADILYLPCTCFTDEMMVELSVLLQRVEAPHAVVITTTRTLAACAHLRHVRSTRCKYKRGSLDFHIYQRQSHSSDLERDVVGNGSPPRKAHKQQQPG